MSTSPCRNCAHPVQGNFCPQCGQSAEEHRINAAYFFHDIPHSVLHIDKGLFYTFLQLLKRPGETLKEYLAGKRVRHSKPLAYVLILSAASSFLVHWNTWLIQRFQDNRITASTAEPFFAKYQSIFIFLMIPVVSVWTWIVFRKHQYNFWEHVLVNTFLAAQLNVLVVLIQVFVLAKFWVTGSPHYSFMLSTYIFMTGFMTYYAITFSPLMKNEDPSWKLGLKLAAMCCLLAYIYTVGMSFAGLTSRF